MLAFQCQDAPTACSTGDNSSGSVAVFELTVGGARRMALAHRLDPYEETIYRVNGVLTWTVDQNPTGVHSGQGCMIAAADFRVWTQQKIAPTRGEDLSGQVNHSSKTKRFCQVPYNPALQ